MKTGCCKSRKNFQFFSETVAYEGYFTRMQKKSNEKSLFESVLKTSCDVLTFCP